MALKILLADDSMTAQNMGKKILADAGYEVYVVSNGAAAVKKVPEQKPDIIIADIYMPGYTGLEVCERVKNSFETSRIPVLLSVGKMEPFQQQDAIRAKADGVIIKPFEATDLLAVIERLAENIRPATQSYAQPVGAPETSAPKHIDPETEHSEFEDPQPEPIRVSQEMAASPVFADDFLTDELAPAVATPTAEASSADELEEHLLAADANDFTSLQTQSLQAASAFRESALAEEEPAAEGSASTFAADPALELDGFHERTKAAEPQASTDTEYIGEASAASSSMYTAVNSVELDSASGGESSLNAHALELETALTPSLAVDEIVPNPELVADLPPEPGSADRLLESENSQEETIAGIASDDEFEARLAAALSAYEFEPGDAHREVEDPVRDVTSPTGPEPHPVLGWVAEETPLAEGEESTSLEQEMLQAAAANENYTGAEAVTPFNSLSIDELDLPSADEPASTLENCTRLTPPLLTPMGRTSFDDELDAVMRQAAMGMGMPQNEPEATREELEETSNYEQNQIDSSFEPTSTLEAITANEVEAPLIPDEPEDEPNNEVLDRPSPAEALVETPIEQQDIEMQPLPVPEDGTPSFDAVTNESEMHHEAEVTASASQVDEQTVVEIVNRVVARLRPELIQEITEILKRRE